MPMPSITKEDVRAAYEALKAQGIPDPGIHRIRGHIGRGSTALIGRFKHEIRMELAERVMPGKNKPIPDPITQRAAELWEELLDAIEKIDQQRAMEALTEVKTVREQLAELEEKLQDTQAKNAEAIDAQEDLAHRLDETTAERDTLKDELCQANETIRSLNAEIEMHEVRLEAVKEQLVHQGTSQKQEIGDLKTQIKHCEQDKFRLNQQYAGQTDFFQAELSKRDATIEALERTVRRLSGERDQAYKRAGQVDVLTREIEVLRGNMEQLKEAHAEHVQRIAEQSQAEIKRLREDLKRERSKTARLVKQISQTKKREKPGD